MENHKYIVSVSGMYDEPYAIDNILEVEGGLQAVPFQEYLNFHEAKSLQAILQAKYPKYKFDYIRVLWHVQDQS